MSTSRPVAVAREPHEARRLNPWVQFALIRGASLIGILLVLVVATFLILHLIPGDPARRIAGPQATPEFLAQLRQNLGLNRPLWQQFTDYLHDVSHLDFGRSYATGEDVSFVLGVRLPKTAQLAGFAVALMILFAVPIGIVAGALTREGRHRRLELAFTSITSIGGALPEYLSGTLLAFVFAVVLKILPVAGSGDLRFLLLPGLAVSLRHISTLSRIVRVETLNVLAQDYIRTARSKRLPDRLIYFRHTVRNVLTAVLTIAGMEFAELIGGTVIVENVFAWPGLGTAIVQSVLTRDYPVVQGAVLMLGIAVVIVNMVVDILLGIVDPRSIVKA
jgi:peptide/nickel transport system permease protein